MATRTATARYVLANFGKTIKKARKEYLDFVGVGASQGRKPELTGGGLIRSLGGWNEVKKHRLNKQDRIKGDERILGDSDFVMDVLEEADERYDRRYRLKSLGYDILSVERKVIKLYHIEKEDLYSGSRRKPISQARSLFCYWVGHELGFSLTELARHLGISVAGVGYSVKRGEIIARENHFQLIE